MDSLLELLKAKFSITVVIVVSHLGVDFGIGHTRVEVLKHISELGSIYSTVSVSVVLVKDSSDLLLLALSAILLGSSVGWGSSDNMGSWLMIAVPYWLRLLHNSCGCVLGWLLLWDNSAGAVGESAYWLLLSDMGSSCVVGWGSSVLDGVVLGWVVLCNIGLIVE